jgi:hypothetical protein
MTLVVVLVHRSPQDMSDVRADGHAAVLVEHRLCGLGHGPRMAEARYPR